MEEKSDVNDNMGERDGGPTLSCGGAEMRCRGSGREAYTGGESRRRDRSFTTFKQGKGKDATAIERDILHREVVGKGESEVVLQSQCTMRTWVELNGRMTPNQRKMRRQLVCGLF